MEQNVLLIIAVAAVVIVAAAMVMMGTGTSPQASAGTYNQSNQPTNTVSGSNVTGTTNMSGSSSSGSTTPSGQMPTCGTGNSCLSQSQMAAMFGSGTYNAVYANDPATISFLFGTSGENGTFLSNNVTAYWLVSYNSTMANGIFGTSDILENIFQSPMASTLYAKQLAEGMQYNDYSTINATLNGMTYSYGETTSLYNSTTFVAYKNDKMVYVAVIGKNIAETTLASTVAQDLS